MSGPRTTKKTSPAQLEREIAEALRRKPKASHARASGGRSTRNPVKGRVHAVKARRCGPSSGLRAKGNGKQEEILMVANDAALANQVDRVEKLLAQGPRRTIATAYNVTTPESSEVGDFAERGWEDEDGEALEISDYDIEEAVAEDSLAPVTDTIVKKAVRWLLDHGAAETSSSSYHAGVWYSSPSEVEDYRTGAERSEDFFLRNFTPKEEQLIFAAFKRGRRR